MRRPVSRDRPADPLGLRAVFEKIWVQAEVRASTAGMKLRRPPSFAHLRSSRPTTPMRASPQPAQPRPAGQTQHVTLRPAAQAGNPLPMEKNMTPKWHGLGDYARAVINQFTRRTAPDPRFAAAPTAPSQESTGADGGYLAPPEVTSEVAQVLLSEKTLFGQTDRRTLTRGSFIAPTDATPPWAGPQATWEGEGQPLAQTKMVLSSDLLKLHKMTALIPVTSELYEDAIGLDAYLRRAIPEKLDFKLTDALLSGTGVGQILGALNAPALVTQTKEGAQGAGTIAYANLTKMWNRMYAPARATAVWAMHADVEMAIQGLTTPGGKPVIDYTSEGGFIFGRPVLVTEAAKPIGTPGDIVLLDPRSFLTATRHPEGVMSAVSMHLWFDLDMNALRFTLRVGGQPWLAAPFTRRNGGTTISTLVTLEAR